jgi:hypothetical protein
MGLSVSKMLERKGGFEPPTFSLARRCSTRLSHFRSTTLASDPLRCAEGQNRTDDTSIFSAVLYQLSYLGASSY